MKGLRKLLLISATVAIIAAPARAMTVFDPTNYVENMMQAARALEQVNNQIRSLQNEALMIEYQLRHLQKLDYSSQYAIQNALNQVNGLMGRARGMTYDVNRAQADFTRLYPTEYATRITTDRLAIDARERWRNSMEAFQHATVVQSQIVSNVTADGDTLNELVVRSQGAVGSLQAQQAANELLALSAKQQMQSQMLLAAQYRSRSLEDARAASAEEEARRVFDQFLGERDAYTPSR